MASIITILLCVPALAISGLGIAHVGIRHGLEPDRYRGRPAQYKSHMALAYGSVPLALVGLIAVIAGIARIYGGV